MKYLILSTLLVLAACSGTNSNVPTPETCKGTIVMVGGVVYCSTK